MLLELTTGDGNDENPFGDHVASVWRVAMLQSVPEDGVFAKTEDSQEFRLFRSNGSQWRRHGRSWPVDMLVMHEARESAVPARTF